MLACRYVYLIGASCIAFESHDYSNCDWLIAMLTKLLETTPLKHLRKIIQLVQTQTYKNYLCIYVVLKIACFWINNLRLNYSGI